MSNNPVDQAMKAAEEQKTQSQGALAPQAPAGSTAVATPQPQSMSLDDFSVGAFNVDEFLKVSQFGLRIGNDKQLFDTLEVMIDLSEVQVCEAIKFGNPPTYYKTYDGVNAASGGLWQDRVREAQASDPNARPYKSADIPMTLLTEAKDKSKKTVAEAGTRVGHSLSTTNRGPFQTFIKSCQDQGLMGQTVKVKLGFEERTNKNGNEWGVMTFELLGTPEESELELAA